MATTGEPQYINASCHGSCVSFVEVPEDANSRDERTCVLEIQYKHKLTGTGFGRNDHYETATCVDCNRRFNPCIRSSHVAMKWNLLTKEDSSLSRHTASNEMDFSDSSNVMESFVTFVLGLLEKEEPDIVDRMDKLYDELDENPFAEIVALLPRQQHLIQPEENPYFRARLGLLQRHKGDGLSNLPCFEAYDILTDNHLIDILELFEETSLKHPDLPPSKLYFLLNQVISTPQSSSFIRCKECRERKDKKISSRLKKAIVNTYQQVVQKLTRRQGLHNAGDHGFYHLVKKATAFKTLLRTGLYSPKYIEGQLCEIYDSIVNSVTAGFNNTRGLGW